MKRVTGNIVHGELYWTLIYRYMYICSHKRLHIGVPVDSVTI